MMRLSNDYWNEAKSQRGLTEKSDMIGYWNSIDPKETKEIIRNDCMMTRQRDALDEAGGRFSKITPATVTGQSPSAQIPQQPPNSPWAYADRNVEPPFDTDISAVEPIISERPDAAPDNGLISAVEHPPESAEVSASPPAADSTPPCKSFRRF